jgi:L-lactate dehydrogenase complex protein LldG
MSKARNEILESLSVKGRKTVMPTPWASKTEYETLPSQFAQALRKVKGEVYLASSRDETWEILGKILDELDAQKIVTDGDKFVNQADSKNLNSELEWFFVGEIEGDLRGFCAEADVGLTGADAALAETGSVILKMDAQQSRLASLLPPVHIVLLPASKIIPDIFTWTANRNEEMPSQLVIISGPSKTADIEQTLVVGVHGPKRFIVIVYDD